ncbi:MAG: hypothetical protein ACQEP8_01240 [Chlamydiota bacterium]
MTNPTNTSGNTPEIKATFENVKGKTIKLGTLNGRKVMYLGDKQVTSLRKEIKLIRQIVKSEDVFGKSLFDGSGEKKLLVLAEHIKEIKELVGTAKEIVQGTASLAEKERYQEKTSSLKPMQLNKARYFLRVFEKVASPLAVMAASTGVLGLGGAMVIGSLIAYPGGVFIGAVPVVGAFGALLGVIGASSMIVPLSRLCRPPEAFLKTDLDRGVFLWTSDLVTGAVARKIFSLNTDKVNELEQKLLNYTTRREIKGCTQLLGALNQLSAEEEKEELATQDSLQDPFDSLAKLLANLDVSESEQEELEEVKIKLKDFGEKLRELEKNMDEASWVEDMSEKRREELRTTLNRTSVLLFNNLEGFVNKRLSNLFVRPITSVEYYKKAGDFLSFVEKEKRLDNLPKSVRKHVEAWQKQYTGGGVFLALAKDMKDATLEQRQKFIDLLKSQPVDAFSSDVKGKIKSAVENISIEDLDDSYQAQLFRFIQNLSS